MLTIAKAPGLLGAVKRAYAPKEGVHAGQAAGDWQLVSAGRRAAWQACKVAVELDQRAQEPGRRGAAGRLAAGDDGGRDQALLVGRQDYAQSVEVAPLDASRAGTFVGLVIYCALGNRLLSDLACRVMVIAFRGLSLHLLLLLIFDF